MHAINTHANSIKTSPMPPFRPTASGQQPVSSFGIMCFRRRPGSSHIEYLMVQRKDSLAYVEFIRGKYNLQGRSYLLRLLSNMTRSERIRIRTSDFDQLWHGFWQSDHTRSFMKEYDQSKNRFESLRRGYHYNAAAATLHAPASPSAEIDTSPTASSAAAASASAAASAAFAPQFFSMDVALDSTKAEYDETEFGFPKGRRNLNESDLQCALREFAEESGISASDLRMCGGLFGGHQHQQQFEEVFTGSNNVWYRHVYYVAELRQDSRAMSDVGVKPSTDPVQMREVRAVGWFDSTGVLARIRDHNIERRNLFTRIHRMLIDAIAARKGRPLNPMAPPFHATAAHATTSHAADAVHEPVAFWKLAAYTTSPPALPVEKKCVEMTVE